MEMSNARLSWPITSLFLLHDLLTQSIYTSNALDETVTQLS